MEAVRKEDGLLHCTHPDCVNESRAFSRRCEYTKHTDKHTRPYVCEEVGCERIQGFTYSGGLHRHQKEVHHKHGNPKASCLCPHRDCQRSIVGRGFTRKENLAEHLRRVHRRDVDEPAMSRHTLGDTIVDGGNSSTPSSDAQVSSKRRKTALDDCGPDSMDSRDAGYESREDLKLEVKRLLRELQSKDDRVKYLESVVDKFERLPRGPDGGHNHRVGI